MTTKSLKTKAIAKTITWRLIASITTFILAQLFGLSMEKAFYIASVEVVIKMLFYYWHERMWQRVGRKRETRYGTK